MPIESIGQDLLQYTVAHPEQAGTALLAVLGTLFNYRQTGNLPVGRLPWQYARRLVGDLGDKYFGVTRPRGVPAVVVDERPAAVMAALRGCHYESTDLYSYEQADEAWGLRRPSGTHPHPVTGEPTPMETHPRGFHTDDGRTLINCHDEASRFERTGDHLAESMLSWERGRDIIAEDLQALSLSYGAIESEAAANINVVPPGGSHGG